LISIALIDIEVQRMLPFQGGRRYLLDRTVETLGLLYKTHWPFYQYTTARCARRSHFHDRLKEEGAVYGELAGWERPNWFAPKGVTPEYEYSYGKQNWFPHTARECLATRDAVALYDQSTMTKFMVEGRDALAVLESISCNRIDVPLNKVVYTQWLNERGGIEADLTVTRTGETQFMVVSAAPTQLRDFTYLRRHAERAGHCFVSDLTAGLPMLGLMGPKSRAVLQKAAPHTDFSNEAFPFGTSQIVEIGYAPVRASRITYVGGTGLGAVHPRRVRTACVRAASPCWRGVRAHTRRHACDERVSNGERLSPLGRRYQHRGHEPRSGPWFRGRLGQALSLPRQGSAAPPEGGRSAEEAPGAGPA
jgi:4-methylaminobutanoate oxidase (formaldehyde-forming)